MCVCMYICMYVCMYVYIYIYIYIYIPGRDQLVAGRSSRSGSSRSRRGSLQECGAWSHGHKWRSSQLSRGDPRAAPSAPGGRLNSELHLQGTHLLGTGLDQQEEASDFGAAETSTSRYRVLSQRVTVAPKAILLRNLLVNTTGSYTHRSGPSQHPRHSYPVRSSWTSRFHVRLCNVF